MFHALDNWLKLRFLGYNYEDAARMLFHVKSPGRFKWFMEDVLREVSRILKWNRATIMVLGVKVKGRIVDMVEAATPIAEGIGFEVTEIISDSIPKSNRYLWYLKDAEGVREEVILKICRGDHQPQRIRIDWGYAKPLTVIKECLG